MLWGLGLLQGDSADSPEAVWQLQLQVPTAARPDCDLAAGRCLHLLECIKRQASVTACHKLCAQVAASVKKPQQHTAVSCAGASLVGA